MIHAHGTYVFEHFGAVKERSITAEEAVAILKKKAPFDVTEQHIEQHRELDPTDKNLMLNKSFVCLEIVDGEGNDVQGPLPLTEEYFVRVLYLSDWQFVLVRVPATQLHAKVTGTGCVCHTRLRDWMGLRFVSRDLSVETSAAHTAVTVKP